jgi:type IV pilus assembly protein PilM
MMMLLGKRHSFIGLDMGSRSMKAVQVAHSGKQPRIEAAAVIPYLADQAHLDEAGARRLRDVLHRQGFHGHKLVVAAAADKLHVELLDLPPRHSGAPIDQIAQAEMMRMAKLEANAFEMATWDLPAPPRGGTGTAVMAVAAKHSDTTELCNTMESAGLSIEAIDVQACAIARACRPRLNETGVTAILDLGFNRAVMMFVRDGVVVFQRSFVHCGLCNVQAELMKRIGVDADVADHLICESNSDVASPQAATVHAMIGRYADALTAELETSFAYVNHRYNDAQPATIFVIGGGSTSNAAREALRSRLNVGIEPLSPMKLAECAPSTTEKCTTALLTTALGLALYEGD